MFIYKILNLINGKIYIGQTTKSIHHRLKRHLYLVRKGKNRYLYDAIRKYGSENFSIDEIETCYSKDELNEREKFWIKHFKSNEKECGYNMNEGGTGGRQSREIVELIASKKRGVPLTEEHKRNISIGNRGKSKTPEHNKKVSESNKGKKRSEECIQEMKLRCVGKKSPMEGRNHSEETKSKLATFRKGKKLKEVIGEESANKSIELSRKRFIENNPTYKEVDKDELEKFLLSDILLVDIATHFNVSYPTIINKIKKYWGLVGVDEFRIKFLGTNPTKHRKRKRLSKGKD